MPPVFLEESKWRFGLKIDFHNSDRRKREANFRRIYMTGIRL